jgi:hypothetical protein
MVAVLTEQLAGLHRQVVRIGDIQPIWSEERRRAGIDRRAIGRIKVHDREYHVTDRFMQSLASRFHVGGDFFRYFTPSEVFTRIQEVHPRGRVRLTTDRDTVLGMSNPDRPIVHPEELCRLLAAQNGQVVQRQYQRGVVTSVHQLDEPPWKLGKEVFTSTFTLETPVDGFGLPSIYLSLIRQLCTNGMIGYAPAFRTNIPLGKHDSDGAAGPLRRAMDCFSNEEGYAAVRQRLASARTSEASVYEVRMLCRAMSRDTRTGKDAAMQPVYDRLWKLTGDISIKYGVASDQAISRKKQSMLPMDCTVYELMTFATELATHHAHNLVDGRQIHAWVGQTLATEYDLEGSLCRGEAEETPAFYLR